MWISMTRRIWLPWKYWFLAVVKCQAVWALPHSLGYISDVDRGACCMGNSLSSISPLSRPAPWEDPSVPLQSDHSEMSPQWESLYQIHLTGSHSSGSRSRFVVVVFTLIWTKKEWVNEQLLVRLMKQIYGNVLTKWRNTRKQKCFRHKIVFLRCKKTVR